MTPALWRIGIFCGLLVGAQLVVRLLLDTFAPPAPTGYGPRSTMTTLLAVATFLVTGFAAGYRTRRVGSGALAAVIASAVGHAIGILVTLVLFFTVIRHDLTMIRTFEMTGGFDETFFLPVMLLPIVAGLGLVGGSIGIGLGSVSRRLRTAGRT
jgi:hypothetical protein